MSKNLVIVESPSKAKTIKKYLGEGFEVTASVGHVKDLPKSDMGVDVEKGFSPRYVTIRGKNKVLKEIKDLAKKSDVIYLGPDPDREGEAIAWHLAEEIRKSAKDKPIFRVMINEITQKGVKDALNRPKQVNTDRFYSQQARRILDRLVGYQISPLLWKKVRRGLSAGRVQSVAVRLIVDREGEISIFDPLEYWSIQAELGAAEPPAFEARLLRIADEKAEVGDGETAHAIVSACQGRPFMVKGVVRRERKRNPSAPFTTSTLQQAAAHRLRFTAKKTMQIAQQLYEGIELGDDVGAVGLITYMRTDSTRLSDGALASARDYIKAQYGESFLPSEAHVYKSKKKNVQDAHEAIRPTSMEYSPETVKGYLNRDQHRLYELIWNRFVACQMEAARYDQTSLDIANGDYLFRSSGSILTFAGYLAVYGEEEGEDTGRTLPEVNEGDELKCLKLTPIQHFTQPPPRFSEATLVKELEDKGIGRPSTYASIISTIQDKGYVEKDGGRFKPTELGSVVTQLLVENFPEVLSWDFTAQMESELDQIEEGALEWTDVLDRFYGPFNQRLDTAQTEMRNLKEESTPTDIDCEECGSKLVIKWGKNGYFLGCSAYPECRFTSEFERDEEGEVKLIKEEVQVMGSCDKCETGAMVVKSGRYGRFLACSNYPTCKNTKGFAVGFDCPSCGSEVIEKRSRKGKVFYGCSSYPGCKFAVWQYPVAIPCGMCSHGFLTRKDPEGQELVCPECKSSYESEGDAHKVLMQQALEVEAEGASSSVAEEASNPVS